MRTIACSDPRVGVSVGVGVGVAVGVDVGVAVAVGVGVAVSVGVGVRVAVGDGVRVAVGVYVNLGVGVHVGGMVGPDREASCKGSQAAKAPPRDAIPARRKKTRRVISNLRSDLGIDA